ncbi:MAG: SAM-dependent methyltransferase [Dinoroseobacter sp.]|nr:SAM-dependent methyltransferase [Dinoroseobacter sp.]
MTTPLSNVLKARIEQTGPMGIAEFMTECLLNPNYGYYTTRDPLGDHGDFITAPEISQMFGELVGLALVQSWLEQGAPENIVLAELGPGRGTLMADALRAMSAVPGARFVPHLVEASPHLRKVQSETLSDHTPIWHDHIDDLPEGPLFLIANEFFDALPIRQYIRTQDAWSERQVGLVDGALSFGLAPPVSRAELEDWSDRAKEGDMIEISPAAPVLAEEIARRIQSDGGAALIIDYGSFGEMGDTFQAVRAHQKESPLVNPGEADLTAHVDFAAISKAVELKGAQPSGPVPQGVFLETLGITQRAQALAKRMSGATLETHVQAHRRLTHPKEMGSLFKVLGITPSNAPPIAGTVGVSETL